MVFHDGATELGYETASMLQAAPGPHPVTLKVSFFPLPSLLPTYSRSSPGFP